VRGVGTRRTGRKAEAGDELTRRKKTRGRSSRLGDGGGLGLILVDGMLLMVVLLL
jgi:hypothetical protein